MPFGVDFYAWILLVPSTPSRNRIDRRDIEGSLSESPGSGGLAWSRPPSARKKGSADEIDTKTGCAVCFKDRHLPQAKAMIAWTYSRKSSSSAAKASAA